MLLVSLKKNTHTLDDGLARKHAHAAMCWRTFFFQQHAETIGCRANTRNPMRCLARIVPPPTIRANCQTPLAHRLKNAPAFRTPVRPVHCAAARRPRRPSVVTVGLNIIHRAPSTHPPSVRRNVLSAQGAHARNPAPAGWLVLATVNRDSVRAHLKKHAHAHAIRSSHLLLFCYFYVVCMLFVDDVFVAFRLVSLSLFLSCLVLSIHLHTALRLLANYSALGIHQHTPLRSHESRLTR